jgi:hypothetical protein
VGGREPAPTHAILPNTARGLNAGCQSVSFLLAHCLEFTSEVLRHLFAFLIFF